MSMEPKAVIEKNQQLLNLAFKHQCEQNWDESWQCLLSTWENLEKFLPVIDNQPQIQQVLSQRRELLPNMLLQSVEESVNDIVVASQNTKKVKKKIAKAKNFWSEEETKKLKEATRRYGRKNLKTIASYIGTRTLSQIRSKLQKFDKQLEKTRATGNRKNARKSGR